MFSGIVEKLGKVAVATHEQGALALRIATGHEDLVLGESIAVNGVCLTVAALASGGMADFFASAETLLRTNLGSLKAGSAVNLERAVSLNTRLSGHLVQGHIDGTAVLRSVVQDAGAWTLEFEIPNALARYCVEKGSIALDGISLTINTMKDLAGGTLRIGLTIIPHTWEHTNLNSIATGDAVNVEVDVMAKYVERLCQPYPKP